MFFQGLLDQCCNGSVQNCVSSICLKCNDNGRHVLLAKDEMIIHDVLYISI